MKKILFIVVILLVVPVFFLGYLGFIPGLSTLLGAGKPKNLGITYTAETKKSAISKLSIAYEQLPGENMKDSLKFEGQHRVDQLFTSEEITALADTRQSQYKYFPFKNVQIRVNTDGTVEGSAVLEFNTALSYLQSLGVTLGDIQTAIEKLQIVRGDLPVYLKGSGEVVNNNSSIAIESVQIARFTVPQEYVKTYAPAINTLVENVISSRKPYYDIQLLKNEEGKIRFVGTAPDKELAIGK